MKPQIIQIKVMYALFYECVLSIDTSIFSGQMVQGCLNFFDWEYDTEEDPYIEYAKKIAQRCFGLSIVHSFDYIQSHFIEDAEGWPPLDGTYGITLVSLDDLQIDEQDMEVIITQEGGVD